MQESEDFIPKHVPWNKDKLIGAKPPLRPSHVWSIRAKLQIAQRARDLALLNVAIDSKLRGCDVVATGVTMLDRELGAKRIGLMHDLCRAMRPLRS